MTSRQLTIINKLGLHARAAAKFVSLASGFDSDITLVHNTAEVNGKSIMGIMMLAAGQGTQIELRAEGPDETDAARALADLVAERFGEDE